MATISASRLGRGGIKTLGTLLDLTWEPTLYWKAAERSERSESKINSKRVESPILGLAQHGLDSDKGFRMFSTSPSSVVWNHLKPFMAGIVFPSQCWMTYSSGHRLGGGISFDSELDATRSALTSSFLSPSCCHSPWACNTRQKLIYPQVLHSKHMGTVSHGIRKQTEALQHGLVSSQMTFAQIAIVHANASKPCFGRQWGLG